MKARAGSIAEALFEVDMRFIMLLHNETGWFGSAGTNPCDEDALLRYERALARAGVLLGAERVADGQRAFSMFGAPAARGRHALRSVANTATTLRAIWFVQLKSRDEAIEWARRFPLESPRMHIQVHRVR